VCHDIEGQLATDREGRFVPDKWLKQATYALSLTVETHPADQGFTLAHAGGVAGGPGDKTPGKIVADIRRQLSMDDRFGMNLGYPRLAITFTVSVTTVEADEGVNRLSLAPGVPAVSPAVLSQRPGVQTAAVTGGQPLALTEDERADASPKASSRHTRDGLPIEGGAKELPDAILETREAHRRAHKAERDDILTGNRIIENPNAARREVKLPVPAPTSIGRGQVVDLSPDDDIL